MENNQIVESEKNRWVALIICILGGAFGLHHFYVGNIIKGIIYLFTLGLCGFGWLIDIFIILFGYFKDNTGAPLKSTKFNNELKAKVNEKMQTIKENRDNKEINQLSENGFYYMEISKLPFTIWLIISIIVTVLSLGIFSPILIVPLCKYFILKNCRYYYDKEKLIIEKGVFTKTQWTVPLYKIVNITAQDNIFNYGCIYIRDKQQLILLKYVNHSREEMSALVEKWEDAKEENIRHEII